jgi:hypothetical protein
MHLTIASSRAGSWCDTQNSPDRFDREKKVVRTPSPFGPDCIVCHGIARVAGICREHQVVSSHSRFACYTLWSSIRGHRRNCEPSKRRRNHNRAFQFKYHLPDLACGRNAGAERPAATRWRFPAARRVLAKEGAASRERSERCLSGPIC